jgi:hypothetical protein
MLNFGFRPLVVYFESARTFPCDSVYGAAKPRNTLQEPEKLILNPLKQGSEKQP